VGYSPRLEQLLDGLFAWNPIAPAAADRAGYFVSQPNDHGKILADFSFSNCFTEQVEPADPGFAALNDAEDVIGWAKK